MELRYSRVMAKYSMMQRTSIRTKADLQVKTSYRFWSPEPLCSVCPVVCSQTKSASQGPLGLVAGDAAQTEGAESL